MQKIEQRHEKAVLEITRQMWQFQTTEGRGIRSSQELRAQVLKSRQEEGPHILTYLNKDIVSPSKPESNAFTILKRNDHFIAPMGFNITMDGLQNRSSEVYGPGGLARIDQMEIWKKFGSHLAQGNCHSRLRAI